MASDRLVINMKVTNKGLVTTDVPMDGKKMTIRKGTRVRLVFNYADINGNAHQFTLVSTKSEVTSRAIGPDAAQSATIEFTVGQDGEAFYRVSCQLPCIAMEDLTDYLIMVG
jgi:hypothetical protein